MTKKPSERQTNMDQAKPEHAEEAARLKRLPRAEQRAIVAMHRAVASNPKVPKADRVFGLERAEALEKLLQLTPKKKGTKH